MTCNVKQRLASIMAAAAGSKKQERRQAISGMIVTIILIGIVVSIGGILATTTTDIVQTGLVLDAVEIKRLAIQNTGTQSYITGMVKNAGNTDVQDVTVIVTVGDTATVGGSSSQAGSVFVAKFVPNDINSGVSATVNEPIRASTGAGTYAYPGGSGTAFNFENIGNANHGITGAVGTGTGNARLTIGEEYLVEIRANIAGGGVYSQTKVLSPQ
ncbi:MAG: hypothetical protein OXK17_00795 [Thaumarchaeota archaeon]|nr:hypothetical protein [Nitrososphaerota archaeon]